MSNYLDTRTLQERLDELTIQRDQFVADKIRGRNKAARQHSWDDSEDGRELAELEGLRDEVYGWADGVQLIPENEFEDYARQFAEDIGAIERENAWPCCHIDWSSAADSLKMDYSEVTYQGTTYLYRA